MWGAIGVHFTHVERQRVVRTEVGVDFCTEVSRLPLIGDEDSCADGLCSLSPPRFGAPVVFLLFLAATCTTLGHDRGQGRSGLDYPSKVFPFKAATFSLWAGFAALVVGSGIR